MTMQIRTIFELSRYTLMPAAERIKELQEELSLLTMLEVDMKNGHIDPNDTDWAKSFNEGLGKSKTSSEFKTKCIYLIVNYNELRCKGLPHYLAVQELKNEK